MQLASILGGFSASWGVLGALGALWAALGGLLARLGDFLGRLGGILRPLCAVLVHLGGVLGPLGSLDALIPPTVAEVQRSLQDYPRLIRNVYPVYIPYILPYDPENLLLPNLIFLRI